MSIFFIIACVLFLITAFGIAQTYLFYPLITIATGKKKKNSVTFQTEDDLPEIAILCAAYNEESIIEEKIKSVFNTNYPYQKIKFFIGSDASNDATNQIITTYSKIHPGLRLVNFPGRTGKPGIINQLSDLSDAPIFILTDANVLFEKETIFNLIRHFKEKQIGLVAANIHKRSPGKIGIAEQEKSYMDLENKLKLAESNKYGFIMGAEGGCFAIRKNTFEKVPPKFNVDDFYITMKVIEKGMRIIFDEEAVCKEDLPTESEGEFRRKVRISTGNFQNLNHFKHMLYPPFEAKAFAFFSHKVLRWYTPFLLLLTFNLSLVLAMFSSVFFWIFIAHFTLFISPIADKILSKVKIQLSFIRFASHFVLMNAALLKGFIRYRKGVQTNVWTPVKRNV